MMSPSDCRSFIPYAAAQKVCKNGIPAMMKILDLSRMTCFYFTGINESWCSRAYRLMGVSRGWRIFARTMSVGHCKKSWEYYNSCIDDPK